MYLTIKNISKSLFLAPNFLYRAISARLFQVSMPTGSLFDRLNRY